MHVLYLGLLTFLLGMISNQPAAAQVDCSDLDFPISHPYIVDDYFEIIQQYLNAGCSPFEIDIALKNQEWIQAEYSLADFEGDGNWEIVFAAHTCTGGGIECTGENTGGLSVYQYVDEAWLATILHSDWYINQVRIIAIDDLVASAAPELVVKYREQGSGCAEKLNIYQLQEDSWESLEFGGLEVPGSGYLYDPTYIDCGLKVNFSDKKPDGNKEIRINFVTAPGYLAHGGVGQNATATYTWDGNIFQPRYFRLYPSPYRIHTLRDAQVALDTDRYLEAAYFYRIAAHDDQMIDTLSWGEWDNDTLISELEKTAHAYQTGFAHFRLAAIWLHLGFSERAQREIDDLALLFPKDTPGSEFVDIAWFCRNLWFSRSASNRSRDE